MKEKISSIGFRNGEEGGKYTTLNVIMVGDTVPDQSSAMETLSQITTCLGCSDHISLI